VNVADDLTTLLPGWIKDKVVPAYTVASVNYFQSLPGDCSKFLSQLMLFDHVMLIAPADIVHLLNPPTL